MRLFLTFCLRVQVCKYVKLSEGQAGLFLSGLFSDSSCLQLCLQQVLTFLFKASPNGLC